MEGISSIRTLEYGSSGRCVVLLHGGPGAPGYMSPLAMDLASEFRVLEPWQRGNSKLPLTVTRHVEDLREVIVRHCPGGQPALVGHSWGAMLALAYAASYPKDVRSLALVGCGTFDPESRRRMEEILAERTTSDLQLARERLAEKVTDLDERLRTLGRLMEPLYSYHPLSFSEPVKCDAVAHEESWNDMLRLQSEGIYPEAFRAIKIPVVMMHGAHDPHPGKMIRDSLLAHMPQLKYVEWHRCGHYPWLEEFARRDFLAALRLWLRSETI